MQEYKFGPDVLLEIVAIVQDGLMKKIDISQRLRDMRLKCDVASLGDPKELMLIGKKVN
jgi:hypothetical protein